MGKVVISIEDSPGGKISIKCDPEAKEILTKWKANPDSCPPCWEYAGYMIETALLINNGINKAEAKPSPIWTPKN